jgi:xanthosine utilization system XapX-like protein
MLLRKASHWLSYAGPSEVRQALTLWLLVATGFMLFPFRFDYQGPQKVTSGLQALEGGGVRFEGPSVLRTKAAPVWVDAAVASGQLDIDLRLRSADPNQRGPARIVTLSDGSLRRNFMVSQKGSDLLVRARREGADDNGAPPLKVDNVFKEPKDLRIEVRFRDRLIEIFVDGQPRYREVLKRSSLDLWDTSYRLGIGDEVDGARGWDGELRAATATVKGATYDLLTAPNMEAPETFWHVPQQTRRLFQIDPSYAIPVEAFHTLFFMPFGALLWLRKRRSGVATLLKIALAGLLLGAIFQLIKVAFPGRHPSLFHAPFNMVGSVAGVVLCPWLIRFLARGASAQPSEASTESTS